MSKEYSIIRSFSQSIGRAAACLAIALMICFTVASSAQAQSMAGYAFAPSSGTFTHLSGATVQKVAGGNTESGNYALAAIGFDFTYKNAVYSQAVATTGGFWSLGKLDALQPADFLSSTATRPLSATLAPTQTFTVTRTGDRDETCVSGVDCSLREAIKAANGTLTDDTINFAIPAGDPDCSAGVCTITLYYGELTATAGTLTITNSTGASNLLISGNNWSRVFGVLPGAHLKLSGVTITKGDALGLLSDFADVDGSGILNQGGTLTLTDSIVSGNNLDNSNSPYSTGAGISSIDGTMTLINSTVSGNSLTGSSTACTDVCGGGGIYNRNNTTTLINSTVGYNSVSNNGGGILSYGGTTTLTNSIVIGNSAGNGGGMSTIVFGTNTLTNSTVSGNTARSAGGIYTDSYLTMTNSTVSGNSASTFAGGIYKHGGTLNLTGVTVTKNSLTNCSIACAGGIAERGSPNPTLKNTIVAGNTSASSPDYNGGVETGSAYNLIGNGTGVTGITNGDANHNQVGVDPLLDPTLQLNGGTTPNHALLPGSPAIDKGNSFTLTTDQRGLTRPYDDPAITNATGGDGADIGAYEVQSTSPTPTPTPTPIPTPTPSEPLTLVVTRTGDRDETCVSGVDCSLREAVKAANKALTDDTINFAIPAGDPGCSAGVCTITLYYGELTATAGTVTITNSTGASNLLISGNNWSRVFGVLPGAHLKLSGVTITKGDALGLLSDFADVDGSGILNQGGTLTLTDSIVSGNNLDNSNSPYSTGAGISSIDGTMTLINSTVSGNSLTGSSTACTDVCGGGGIYNRNNTTTLINSTVGYNSASNNGGGILSYGGTTTLTNSIVIGNSAGNGGGMSTIVFGTNTLTNSTVSGNTARSAGGIYTDSYLTMTNSTVSGNSASTFAGGIYKHGGTLNLTGVTVTKNSLTNCSIACAGGIAERGSPNPTLKNTIVAGNTSASSPDYNGGVETGSAYNLIGNGTGVTGITNGDANHNQVGVDPLLDPTLQLNGGTTPNHALLPGSPAIDKGNSFTLTTDQRGLTRPYDDPAITNATGGDGADIGAYEVQSTSPTPTPTPTPTPNTPPNAANDTYSVNEDATLNISAPGVLANDTDGENNSLTAQQQTSPANAASFVLNADGSFSYTPNANFNGTDSFTYTSFVTAVCRLIPASRP
jgi:CSLREA domain-containing protein